MGFRVVNEPPKPPVKARKRARRVDGKVKKILFISTGVLALGAAGLGGATAYNHVSVKSASASAQKVALNKPANVASMETIAAQASKLDYGSNNHGIPSAKQLEAYQNLPEKVYGRGFIAVPKQQGVTQPITSLAINEGVSDKVLAVGAGTPRAGEMMGDGNFSVAAHNFGNDETYFSPMQRNVDVNAKPKAYVTDGKRLFTYQFNKTSDDVSGRTVVNYRQGSVLDDSVGKGKAILTLITCDEPGLFTLHPENRLLLRAHLVSSEPISQATDAEKALFPQIFNT
ncbi:hypothetical protein B9D04_04220 [Weissella cibaria]|uniref:Sortase n=1 Tax=Weissella cibaria TaxID=137591 RepID=A0A1X4JLW0_9LACO|nr:class A sortase [Weissella cibaria]OSP89731.1 hypothetical protein B9D04_04220 [Weissella cibaria]